MTRRSPSPDQLPLRLVDGAEDDLERIIEARVAARAEADALRWRFRLVVIESVMMGSLIIAAGFALDQPTGLVLRGAGLVAAGGFLTGLILIALSAVTSRLLARWRRRS